MTARFRQAPVETPGTIRPEALAALQDELRAELTNAVLALNVNQIKVVIKRVSEVDGARGAVVSCGPVRLYKGLAGTNGFRKRSSSPLRLGRREFAERRES